MAERFLVDVQAIPLPIIVAEGYFVTAERLEDLEEPVEDIARFISSELQQNFVVGGRPPWQPHAPATVERWGPHPLLDLTGDLRDEIVADERWDIDKGRSNVTAAFTAGPVTDLYGRFHLSGTQFMPVRDFMALPVEIQDKALEMFDEWVGEQL